MSARSIRLGACAAGFLVAALAVSGPAAPQGGFAGLDPSTLVFPAAGGEWERVTPAAAGWNAAALDDALEYAREQRSSGLVVALGGRILAEGNWEVASDPEGRYQMMLTGRTPDGRAIEDVASLQKSVVSLLAGIAWARGLLDLDRPVSAILGGGWSRATPEQERAITVRHLMTMTSGLGTDGSFEVPVGDRWAYNTNVYSRMVPVLGKVAGRGLEELTAEWLTTPVGMRETEWGERPWVQPGQDANRVGLRTTARDLARFGLLVLADGRWGARDVLGDPGWLDLALAPSQEFNPAYGLLWWLNGQDRLLRAAGRELERPLVPSAPGDLVAAQGALTRLVHVVPSLRLVVTRIGDQPPDGAEFATRLWERLMRAAPAR